MGACIAGGDAVVGVCGSNRPRPGGQSTWERDRPDLHDDDTDEARSLRWSLSSLRHGMRHVDDCVVACVQQQQYAAAAAAVASLKRPTHTLEPTCRFISVSLSAPNWECSMYTYCNMSKTHLPLAWEDANPDATAGRPLFDFPANAFDFVSIEVTQAMASTVLERTQLSSLGKLAALAIPGICKCEVACQRGRRARRAFVATTNSNESVRLAVLQPTHLLGIHSLADCLRCCRDWPGCRYASFAPIGRFECTLFSACDVVRPQASPLQITVEVTAIQ